MKIDGVILTPKAMERLRHMQEDDNAFLRQNIKELTELAKCLTMAANYEDGLELDLKQTLKDVSLLFLVCDQFEALFSVTEEGGAS